MDRIFGRGRRLLLALAVCGVISPMAAAQPAGGGGPGGGRGGQGGPGFFGGPGMMNQFAPTLSRDSVTWYQKALDLTPDQKQAVDRAFDMYEERLKTERDAAQEAMRQAMQERREQAQNGDGNAGPANMGREMITSMVEMRKHQQEMEQGFFTELKGVLSPTQLAQWPKVERARRREHAGSSGFGLSGERVDLVKIVEAMSLSPEARGVVTPILDQYELDLDKELQAREKANDELTTAVSGMSAGVPTGGDPAAMRAMFEKLQPARDKADEAGAKVADVNRRYGAKVQTSLPEDKRPAFVKAVREARFADIFSDTPTAKAVGAAATFEDLTEAQKGKIRSLKTQYERSVADVNTRLATATEKAEAAPQGGGMVPGRMRNPEVREARRQKGDLDQQTYESLKGLLSEEQQQRLPRVPPRFQGPRGGQDGQGGAGGGEAQPRRGRQGGQNRPDRAGAALGG